MLPNVSPGVCQKNRGQTELLFTVSVACSVDPLGSLHKVITITLLGWLLCQALFSAFFFFACANSFYSHKNIINKCYCYEEIEDQRG